MTIRSLDGKTPQVDPTAWVSEAAYLVGDVVVGPGASVFPHTTIRADMGRVTIGANSSIEDNCMIHTGGNDVEIGEEVLVGHSVVVHNRVIGDLCFIGNNSSLNERSEIGYGCVVAAGAVVTEQSKVPPESFVRGVPATWVPLRDDQKERFLSGKYARTSNENAMRFKNEGL